MGRKSLNRFLLCLLFLPAQLALAGNTLVVFPEGSRTLEIQDELEDLLLENGMALGRILTPSQLERGLNIVSVRPGVVDVACLVRVEAKDWLRDLERAEMAVQTFRPDRAVALTSRLEDQLVCLDGIPTRKALRTLYLTRALALTLEGGGSYALTEVVDRVVALGSDLPAPIGLPPDLQNRLNQAGTPESVRAFGGGTLGEIFLDGQSLARGAVIRGPGRHLIQMNDLNGRVSTALLMPFRDGKTLLWAGELSASPIQAEVTKLLARRGPSILLRTISAALQSTILVGEYKGAEVTLFHVDGRRLVEVPDRATRPTPKVASITPRPVNPRVRSVSSRSINSEQSPRKWAWIGGGAAITLGSLQEEKGQLLGAGLAAWTGVSTPSVLNLGMSITRVHSPELQPPEHGEFYINRKSWQIRPGLFWRSSTSEVRPELGLHGSFGWNSENSVKQAGVGASFGLLFAVWEQASWRIQTHGEAGSGWWQSGFQMGVEWSP